MNALYEKFGTLCYLGIDLIDRIIFMDISCHACYASLCCVNKTLKTISENCWKFYARKVLPELFQFEEFLEKYYNTHWKWFIKITQPIPMKDDFTGQGFIYLTEFEEEVSYFGDWENGKLHGIGIIRATKTNCFVVGSYYQGSISGYSMYNTGISTYCGYLVKDKKQNFGVITHGSTSKYIGQWKNDMQHGYGIYFSYSPDVLGKFSALYPESLQSSNKNKASVANTLHIPTYLYIGEFNANTNHGYGKSEIAGQHSYIGQFSYGEVNGIGYSEFMKKKSRKLTWYNRNKVATGIDIPDKDSKAFKEFIAKNENYFLGIIDQRKKKKIGMKFYSHTNFAISNWKDETKNYKTLDIYPNNSLFIGNYINNLKQGEGFYVWPDNDFYIGNWKDGARYGEGTLCLLATGEFLSQYWDERGANFNYEKNLLPKFF